MAISYDGTRIVCEGVIYEDEVVPLREKLNEVAPQELLFDLSGCDDMYLSIIQQMLAYKKLYACSFNFSEAQKTYQKLIEGFDENDCNL
ncbi:MAG: hypothetical protein IBX43_09845 [Campylobacterales bacterium]|nr:hypothetical protein [Campylobacterales bacterium]MBE0499521.1 hypothetical protein [Campylobacterales bacterium]